MSRPERRMTRLREWSNQPRRPMPSINKPVVGGAHEQSLHQALLLIATVQCRGDALIDRVVQRDVAVEQIQGDAPQTRLPLPQRDVAPRQFDADFEPRPSPERAGRIGKLSGSLKEKISCRLPSASMVWRK